MRGIIVDNDKSFISDLTAFCKKIQGIKILNSFNNKLEAAAFVQNNTVDFIFMDIDLPLAESLATFESLNQPPAMIIATNNQHFALQAFDYSFVIDYVLKPLCPDRYGRSFLRLAEHLNHKNNKENAVIDKLFINIDKKLTKIYLTDILFIEAKGDYITIHTEYAKYTTYASLKKIYKRLPGHQFVNIHRSFIVNIDKIVDLDQNTILVGKEVLPLSRYKRPDLMTKLNFL